MRFHSLRALAVVVLVAGVIAITAPLVAAAGQDKAKDPVCGMSIDPASARYSTTYNGTKYYFCSENCLNKFKADPARYVKAGETEKSEKVKDPVCGMTIDASQSKYSTTYKDKKYYFCSESCLNKFKADPGKYVK